MALSSELPTLVRCQSKSAVAISVARPWPHSSRRIRSGVEDLLQARIVSAPARARGRWKKPGPPVHDDLVERDFTAAGPNRLWLTDLTEHPTAEGKLYLCAVKDVWSRRIVGYSISDRMPSALAVDALEMAVARRGRDLVTGCVVHADRGSQFRFRPYVAALHRYGLAGSMGRVASSVDNALVESFWSSMLRELLDRRSWASRTELASAMFEWIEGW